jgi:hypothetical protein
VRFWIPLFRNGTNSDFGQNPFEYQEDRRQRLTAMSRIDARLPFSAFLAITT